MMRRREFVSLLGAATAWPLAAYGQQAAKLPILGFVGSDSPDPYAIRLRAFRLGLKATGFTEGQNVAIEYRWAEGHNDKLPALTADLVARQVAVIVAPTTPSVLAAKSATQPIPIVFFTAGGPLALLVGTSLTPARDNPTRAANPPLVAVPEWPLI